MVRVGGVERDWPPVVLESGLGASSVGWSRVYDGLGALTRVIAYDRAGLGASPPSSDDRTLPALAADLTEVIDASAGRPAVLVGHSLGATLVRYLAATRSDLVAALVLIDPIPESWVLRHHWWGGPIGSLSYRTLAGLAHLRLIDTVTALPPLRAVTRSSTSPQAAFTDAERAALAAETRRALSHRAARREFTGLLHSRRQLRALAGGLPPDIPVTTISGTHASSLTRRLRLTATAWQAGLAEGTGSRHVFVDDGGHFIPRFQPDIVVTAVADLLRRLGSSASEQSSAPPKSSR